MKNTDTPICDNTSKAIGGLLPQTEQDCVGDKFETLSKESKKYNENNDCVIKAICVVSGIDYKKVLDVASSYGRKPNCGFSLKGMEYTLLELGFKAEALENIQQENGSLYTPKTIGKLCNDGLFIAYRRGHVLAVENGVVVDWSKDRQHHIKKVYKITKTAPEVTEEAKVKPMTKKQLEAHFKKIELRNKSDQVRLLLEMGNIDLYTELAKRGLSENINNSIVVTFYPKGEFNTFKGWLKKGMQVQKGSKGYPIWGTKITKNKADNKEESTDEGLTGKGVSWHPLANIFHESQVLEVQK